MMEFAGNGRKAILQLLALAALMTVGYLCTRTLRFTNDWFNLVFECVFFLLPFLAIHSVRRLRRGPKVAAWIILVPLLALSSGGLFVTVFDAVAVVEKRELSRELSSVSEGPYTVYLFQVETSGGAIGPHGLSLEQHMFILPGLYLVRYLDYFEGAYPGTLSSEGANKVRLRIPKSFSQPEVDQVYQLHRGVYFD